MMNDESSTCVSKLVYDVRVSRQLKCQVSFFEYIASDL